MSELQITTEHKLKRGMQVTVRGVLHTVEKVNNKSQRLVLRKASRRDQFWFRVRRLIALIKFKVGL